MNLETIRGLEKENIDKGSVITFLPEKKKAISLDGNVTGNFTSQSDNPEAIVLLLEIENTDKLFFLFPFKKKK